MLTNVSFQLSGGATIAVDTGLTNLPIVVQSLGHRVAHGAPYLRDGKVFVDFTSRIETPLSLTAHFARRWVFE
jgi:hypothetical protein